MVVRKHEAMSFIDNRSTIGIPCLTLGWHRSVQKLIPGTDRTRTRAHLRLPRWLQPPEARRIFQEISMNARWVPFCVGVPAPANEEADGTRNRPSPNISTSIHRPIKIGPPVYLP